MSRLEQIVAFIRHTEFAGAELQPLAGDASFRRYMRVSLDGRTAMLMDAPPERENVKPYIAIAEYLHAQGYSAPAILARDIAAGLLLLEDLGDDTFSRILKAATEHEPALYEAAVDMLVNWHDPRGGFSNPAFLTLPEYNTALLLQEIRLFSEWYLPKALGESQAVVLGGDYVDIWWQILREAKLTTNQFVHRDFHADNLMWLPAREGMKRIGLLDFQDAVYGDAAYDLVSLLEDARRDVPPALAEAMIKRYIDKSGADSKQFRTAYHVMAAQRNSKIIGIFVRLCVRDGKQHYLSFLPRVWAHLERDLAHPALAPLRAWLDMHIPHNMRGALTC